jgi:serine/threonine-protein kinase
MVARPCVRWYLAARFAMRFEEGQTIAGRYRLARKLGDGAMGSVHEAENVAIHRRVALKILHPHVGDRNEARLRFEREAQAAGRIGSPHIVEVLDLGELDGGGRFLVMELLEGETLAQRIKARGRLDAEEAASVVAQLLAGLGAAHAAGILHRDLKPANVFLAQGRGAGDFVKILDFGVSKFVEGEGLTMTGTNTVLGTPYYMSPEQAKGASAIDERSDLYSAGVILYECVTGRVPFDASTVNELIFRIVLEAPPPLASVAPGLDPDFVAIVGKAMAREPSERFQTARAFHDALVAWLASSLRAAGGQAALRPEPRAGVPHVTPWLAPAPRRTPDALPAPSPLASGPTPKAFAAPRIVPPPTPSEGDTLIFDRPRPAPARRSGLALPLAILGAVLAATAILFAVRPSSDRASLAGPRPGAPAAPTVAPSADPAPAPSSTAEVAALSTPSAAAPQAPPSAPPADDAAAQRAAVKPPPRVTSPKHVVRRTVSSEL